VIVKYREHTPAVNVVKKDAGDKTADTGAPSAVIALVARKYPYNGW